MATRDKILHETKRLFAKDGVEGVSIRAVAENTKIVPSVIYHYFKDKDTLLRTMFDSINTDLGIKRSKLPVTDTSGQMLRQRIIFQLDNAESIVAVLKYYLAYRTTFPKFQKGFVPDKSSLHIEEVLERGVESGEFVGVSIQEDAKVITHAINGFLMEYFPYQPKGKEKKELIDMIYSFLIRSLTKGTGFYQL
jgi:AcrR family transcriptional regulator